MILTKDQLHALSAPDLARYFSEGFAKIQMPGDRKPYWTYVEDVTPSGVLILVRPNKRQRCYIKQISINLSFPETGLYNYDESVAYVSRIPSRTAHKLICYETLSVKPLFRIDGAIHPKQFLMSVSELTKIFQKAPKITVSSLFHMMQKGKSLGKIIDRDFAISVPLVCPFPQLWYKTELIGCFVSRNHLVIDNPEYLQEAKDKFLPMNFGVDIYDS